MRDSVGRRRGAATGVTPGPTTETDAAARLPGPGPRDVADRPVDDG